MNLIKKCIAEAIGTAVLCFAACGVAVVAGGSDSWWIATSVAFGLVIVAMAYSIGNISGCHINPAVSIAMFISGKMTLKEFLAYVGSQVVGAFVGSALLGLCLINKGGFASLGGNEIQTALLVQDGLNLVPNAWSYIGAFVVELVLTCVFVLAILGVTDSKFHEGKQAGLVIGGALTLVHLIGLGFTGTSVNPARSLAPAVLQAIAGDATSLSQVWIWILAPLAGGAIAALIYKFLTKAKEEKAADIAQ